MRPIADSPRGAILSVRVIPRATRSAFAGLRGGAVLIKLAATPVDGKANETLRRLLAKHLDIGQRRVHILAGTRSRDKRVEIEGVRAADVERALRRTSP